VDYSGAACTILRDSVQQPAPIPATVVIKHWTTGSKPMREEWAALACCGQVDNARELVPELFGAASDAALLIVED
jgi:hypothetical protein